MNLAALSQIAERIAQLSLAEQLWLIERVTQRLRGTLGVKERIRLIACGYGC
jgi:hypothetical protein